MVNMSRMVHIEMEGETDSQALVMALENGSSKSMGHLRLYGEVNFEFLAQLPITMPKVPGTEQTADMVTKTLSAALLKYHSTWFFGFNIPKNEHGAILAPYDHQQGCDAEHEHDIVEDDDACACAVLPADKVTNILSSRSIVMR